MLAKARARLAALMASLRSRALPAPMQPDVKAAMERLDKMQAEIKATRDALLKR